MRAENQLEQALLLSFFRLLIVHVTPIPLNLCRKEKQAKSVADHQQYGGQSQQVTFRELHSGRLRRDRFLRLTSRLHQSLERQFGSLKCKQTFEDFIAEAICCFFEQCSRKRAFAGNDRPVFPYLLKSAQRIALASLASDGKSKYEKARRLECNTTDSEIAFESVHVASRTAGAAIEELKVADDFIDVWNQLSSNQQFVLKASGNAISSGFELRAEDLAEELSASNSAGTFSPSTIRQYKSRALKHIRKEAALAPHAAKD